ncbi:tetratricopeptide repeat protein [Microcoleus sp. FACHB-1515]|uniref:tetratricopeptide repeat protein n=1 Tax=Cyanophyceae TaxID=3028117 RepID=UPI0016897EB4|nr:tetratricopeptide repeat protein [Microcoleus sp. FACHB-1515]MBD2088997.1 tetratricopeptide repeat protein [Microcoleus sp. FACHB-1515]
MITYLEDAVAACDRALQTESNLTIACQTLGNVLQMMGRFSAAVQWHTWAVAPPADRSEMFARIGALYGQQQQREAAIAAYQQAIAANPDYAPAHWSLANLYAELEKSSAEIHHRQQAMRCDPNWATPKHQFQLGNRLMAEQRSDEAIAYYRGAVDRNPEFFEAHYNLAISLTHQQDWSEAKTALARSLELEPRYAPSYYALGQIAQQQDDWFDAQTYFHTAIQLDPDYQFAWCAFGEACLKLHEWNEAASAYQQAIALGANSAWVYHNLGYALHKLHALAAVTWLQQAIDTQPEAWFYLHLAEVQIEQQCWPEATALLLNAAQRQRDLSELYLPLGRSLRRLLQTADTAIVQEMIQPQNQQVDFYQSIAQALAAHQQYEGAALFYRWAIAADAPLHHQLRQVQDQQKQLNDQIAAHYWRIDQVPQAADRYTQLAHLLADQGETEAAIALHRNALERKGWQAAVDREYVFTRDWFSHNIPVWTQHLQELSDRPDVQALEVGCFEGMAACWLLDHILTHPDSRLVCLDRYRQENFTLNIDRAQAVERVLHRLGDSHRLLPRLQNQYDLIYLSADPRADWIRKDGELAWPLLKLGGILIFDYYGWVDQPIEQRSRLGIDAFLDEVPFAADVLHRGYQVIVRKVEE